MPSGMKPKYPGGAHRLPIDPVRRAGPSVMRTIAAGADVYDRRRHLPRLLPVGPAELADESEPARRAVLARLARAVRFERSRGRAGHWTYDLNRHLALCQAYAAERQALRSLAHVRPHPRTAPPPPDSAGGGA
jgi:Family of unknown function (DUF6477)